MSDMKHILLLCAAALVLASCSQDEPEGGILPGGKRPLVINASGLQSIATPQTRGTIDGNWNGVEKVAVQVEDEGRAAVKEYKVEAKDGSGVARLTPATDLTDSGEDALFWWTSTTQTKTVNAWCPYNDGQFPQQWEVPEVQTAENIQATDLLFARKEGMTLQESETEEFVFQHKLSKVRINLKATGYLQSAAKVDVRLLDQYTSASFDNLTLLSNGGRGKAITPYQLETPGSDCYASYEALVIPLTDNDKNEIDELIGITVDGAEYVYRLPDDYNGNLFQQGLVYIFNITVKEQGLEDVSIEQSIEWNTGNPGSGGITLEDHYDQTTNTYYVYTAEGLEDWAQTVRGGNLNAKCLLFDDIDFGGEEWTPVGTYGNNTGFSGIFDGQGHTISNVKITGGDHVGLFAYIEEGGTVQNVTFEDVEISQQTADSYAGVVAGRNDGTIIHCQIVDGTVTLNDVNSRAGGIAGQNYGAVFFCEVTDCSVSNTSGIAGGIVGESFFGQIMGCSFDGRIAVGTYGGGIAGMSSGTEIRACWANVMFADSGNSKGGVCGMLQSGNIDFCYWSGNDYVTAGVGSNTGGLDYTTKVDGSDYNWDIATTLMNDDLAYLFRLEDLEWYWHTNDINTPPTLVPNN